MKCDWKRKIREAFEAQGHVLQEEVAEELAQHAESIYDRCRIQGLDDRTCRKEAERKVALWVSQADGHHRRTSPGAIAPAPARTTWFTGLDHDVRYGLRVLARQPGPTMVGATTIALSIAAVTLVTSVVWSVLLKPLPWIEADQLVRVYEGARGGSHGFGPNWPNP